MDALAHFSEAFSEGHLAAARGIAQNALERGIAVHDHSLEAEARWHLSRVHVVCGELIASVNESQRALLLFEETGDPAGQVQSLISISYGAAYLCDNRLSCATSTSAESLSSECGESALQVAAQTYLGHSLVWDRNSVAANSAFSKAIVSASRLGPEAELHPLLNRASGEAVRLMMRQVLDDAALDPTQLEAWLAEIRARNLSAQLPFFSMNSKVDINAMLACLHGFTACWRGDFSLARDCVAACSAQVAASAVSLKWLAPYAAMAHQQYAFSTGNWPEVVKLTERVTDAARRCQNEQMARSSAAMRLRALEALGLCDEAAKGWRALNLQDWGRHQRLASVAEGINEWQWRRRNGVVRAVETRRGQTEPESNRDEAMTTWRRRFKLTPSEMNVMNLLLQGMQTPDIAKSRGTTVGTTGDQIKSILSKTGYHSRLALATAVNDWLYRRS